MALSILDGTQTATTLSTILSSGQHITAHTVVSLGTQAITDMRSAVSGSVISIPSLPAISGTVTANVQPQQSDDTDPNIKFIPIGYATVDGSGELSQWTAVDDLSPLPVYIPANYPIPTGTNRIGVVTIGGGTVTIGAGTSQIGSVTASISGTVPISISSVTVGNTVAVKTDLDVNSGLPCVAVAFDSIGGVQRVGTTNAFPIRPMQDGAGNTIPLAISGTVTANSSNGSLTTRFGSVTTANTAFATSAVTNANRKYLLIQNITTASNVITVGIGFTPTTTQGIQLFAGAGLTFEGTYIPTGSVNLLSSVTASCYTILEA